MFRIGICLQKDGVLYVYLVMKLLKFKLITLPPIYKTNGRLTEKINYNIMSFKPSRSSGITFHNAKSKSDKYYQEVNYFLSTYDVIPMDKINYLSKCFYLYSLNESKADKILGIKQDSFLNNFYFICGDYYIRIFKRYPNLVYKPLQLIILDIKQI